MTAWRDVERAEPEFARRVQGLFEAHRHKTIATLRADGAPRISGIEAAFEHGELTFGSMSNARKGADLLRDPRFALHSGSSEPDAWDGDAKLSGRAAEVIDPEERTRYGVAAAVPGARVDFDLFRVELEQVVLVALNDEKNALVISSWRPGQGLTRTIRT